MGSADIDFTPYARPPRLDALGGFALAVRLLRSAPKKPSKPVARSLRALRSSAVALQEESKGRVRTRPESVKPIDQRFDNGWTALRDRLASWERVYSESSAKDRGRAAQLVAAYFPDGVAFVQLAFEAEWVTSQQLLELIDEDGSAADIEGLAGAPFLANVREQHAALGAALGLVGKSTEDQKPSTRGIADRVAALGQSIGDYTRRLMGEVDRESAESVAAFRKAVQPLDEYRLGNAPTPANDEVDPAAPVPPAPSE